MKALADGLYQLRGFPPNAINVYLAGDVLIDAATRRADGRILKQLRGRTVSGHALTHAHPDHQGASKAVCEALRIPLWCGDADADAMEQGDIAAGQPTHPLNRLIDRVWTGPPHPVAKRLREGDVVAGFTVLDTPGHSAGHVSYWRETDRVLICGDVMNGMNLLTGYPDLREPPRIFTPDPERNRESIRRLAALDPLVVAFGHGPALRNPDKLHAFAEQLPPAAPRSDRAAGSARQ